MVTTSPPYTPPDPEAPRRSQTTPDCKSQQVYKEGYSPWFGNVRQAVYYVVIVEVPQSHLRVRGALSPPLYATKPASPANCPYYFRPTTIVHGQRRHSTPTDLIFPSLVTLVIFKRRKRRFTAGQRAYLVAFRLQSGLSVFAIPKFNLLPVSPDLVETGESSI